MNYWWTINLHDGYPPLQVLMPEEYIPPSLHNLCHYKATMFHLGDDYLGTAKILLPPGDNGENLEAAANEECEINDDLYKLKALIGHQRSPKAPNLNLKRCKYYVLVEWETGEKTHEPLPVLAADDPVTCASFTKANGISHLNGWKRFKKFGKKDKPDLSCIASPKGEMKSTFSWTILSKTPTSSTLCFGEPTLAELNHEPTLASSIMNLHLQCSIKKLELCITKHIPLCDSVVHTGTTLSVSRSSSETSQVSD